MDMDFSERLRSRREELGLRGVDLAEAAHIRPHTLWRYEAGKSRPGTDSLERLASALDVSMDWLIRGDPPATNGKLAHDRAAGEAC